MATDNEPVDPYSLSRIVKTAERMLSRYSLAATASEMAHWHAMDYPRGDRRRRYWQDVQIVINRLARLRGVYV